jgi:lipopolysaccharide export system protein LptC
MDAVAGPLLPRALTPRQRAALPGSSYDRLVSVVKWALPAAALLVLAVIVIWPLTKVQEFSFLLAKDKVAMAHERFRMEQAVYRGETLNGEPFRITAAGAVQKSSAVPIVQLQALSAELDARDGPATVTAPGGLYNLNTDQLTVSAPVELQSEAGYRLDTGVVDVDLARRTVSTRGHVTGAVPIGTFSADRMSADIQGRIVVLEGNVHLRMVPKHKGG